MHVSNLVIAATVTGALAQSNSDSDSGYASDAYTSDAYTVDAYSSDVYGSEPENTSSVSAGIVYVTETVDSCETETPETVVTVTNGVTVTYCPTCDKRPHTTVYTTVYESLCTDSDQWYTTPATYTVTETCDDDDASPTWSPDRNHIPQDYTVTVKDCQKCATPGPVTITEPCGCHASNGVSLGPATAGPTTTSPASTGFKPSAPAGNDRVGGGQPAANTGASPPPYSMATSAAKCPGPQCASPSGAGGAAASSGNTSGNTVTPYKAGASSSTSAAGLTSCLVVVIAAFAILL